MCPPWKDRWTPKGHDLHVENHCSSLRKLTSVHLVIHCPLVLFHFTSAGLKWVLWCPHAEMSAFWLGLLCIKALLLWRLIFGHFCFDLMYSLISSLTSSRWEVSAKGAVCHTYTLGYKSNSVTSGLIARNKIYEHCLIWSPQTNLSVCHRYSYTARTTLLTSRYPLPHIWISRTLQIISVPGFHLVPSKSLFSLSAPLFI